MNWKWTPLCTTCCTIYVCTNKCVLCNMRNQGKQRVSFLATLTNKVKGRRQPPQKDLVSPKLFSTSRRLRHRPPFTFVVCFEWICSICICKEFCGVFPPVRAVAEQNILFTKIKFNQVKMETLVQRIIIQIKANLSVTTIEGQDISKAIEEEVLSLVRSGQVIEVSLTKSFFSFFSFIESSHTQI